MKMERLRTGRERRPRLAPQTVPEPPTGGEGLLGVGGSRDPESGPIVLVDDGPAEVFQCPFCVRTFPTKIGLGQHKRRGHKEQNNALHAEIVPKHHRWMPEEHAILAKEELSLKKLGVRNINQALANSFPRWTTNQIMQQRKGVAYQRIRKELEEKEASGSSEVGAPGGGPHRSEDTAVNGEVEEITDTGQGDGLVGNNCAPGSQVSRDHNGGAGRGTPVDHIDPTVAEADAAHEGPVQEDFTDRPNGDGAYAAQVAEMFTRDFSLCAEELSDIYDAERCVFLSEDSEKIEQWITRTVERALGWTYEAIRPKGKGTPRPSVPESETRKQRKARLRQKTARYWERDPNGCGKAILGGTLDSVDLVPEQEKLQYWADQFEQESVYKGGVAREGGNATDWSLSHPIRRHEVDLALEKMSDSAVGLDRIDYGKIKNGDLNLLVLVFNVILRTEVVPRWLIDGRVSLIPKSEKPENPGDFRPITVSSMLLRLFHKVLAARLGRLEVGEAQAGFRPMDGCQRNLAIVGNLIRDARTTRQPLFAIFVDVRKAFDSCSRGAILAAAERSGVPPPLLSYLKKVFCASGVWIGDKYIKQNSGVRQGDPLSGALFNFIMDFVCSNLMTEIGYPLFREEEGRKSLIAKINHLLFADDAVLFANSPEGLATQVRLLVQAFKTCGLTLNPKKSMCFGISTPGRKLKNIVVVSKSKLKIEIDGVPVPVMGPSDSYKYLGVKIGPYGVLHGQPEEKLQTKLDRLLASALRPQQKLIVIRRIVIPSMLYVCTLGDVNKGRLHGLDITLRKAVKKILHLPQDVPSAAFHAEVRYGGLGLRSLEYAIPIHRSRRLARLCSSPGTIWRSLMEQDHVRKWVDAWTRTYKFDGIDVLTLDDIKEMFRGQLHKMVDGDGLRAHCRGRQFDQWLTSPVIKMGGREFIRAVHARLGCLNTPSRASRGRGNPPSQKLCWRDRKPASLNHISQCCESTHGLRVERHNDVVKMIQQSVAKQGLVTLREPRLPVGNNKFLVPDLVILSKDKKKLFILDPIISSDFADLTQSEETKVRKYSFDQLKTSAVEAMSERAEIAGKQLDVQVAGLAFNCRGAVAPATHVILKSLCRRLCPYIILRILTRTAGIVETYRRTIHVNRR